MGHYVLEYRYADPEARARARPEHLAYMTRLHDAGKVLLAGPFEDGSGAMVIFHVSDEAEARRLVEEDPYTKAGVSTDVRLRQWNVVIPAQQ